MYKPVQALLDGLYDLPGGFRETMAGYRYDAALEEKVAETSSLDHSSSARKQLEKVLFNRNSLVRILPENIFSQRLAENKRLQLIFRCAISEFGGRRFRECCDLERMSEEELSRAKAGFGNNPLALGRQSTEELRRNFEKGWPPLEYDKRSLEYIAKVREDYADVFDDEILDKFLADQEKEQQRYASMTQGLDAFKRILQTERGQDSILWGLDMWHVFAVKNGKPPILQLAQSLADAFRDEGFHENSIAQFSAATREAFDCYESAYKEGSSLQNAYKGSVIYNIVGCAFYGPENACANCYRSELERTVTQTYEPRLFPVDQELRNGKGESVILEVMPNGIARIVGTINLNSFSETRDELVIVIGRELGGDLRISDDSCDPVVAITSRLLPSCRNFYATRKKADSANHLGIVAIGGEIRLVDLASCNGTKVISQNGCEFCLRPEGGNGAVSSVVAKRGDRVILGASEFIIV